MTPEKPDEPEGNRLRPELEFFGSVMAGVSHELSNAITVISEVAGLLTDFTALADAGRPLPLKRVASQCERIGGQVSRCKSILKRMNSFAHSVDAWDGEFVVGVAVAEVVSLMRRRAEAVNVDLRHEGENDDLRAGGSRFRFQYTVGRLIEACLSHGGWQGSLTITIARSPGHALVGVEPRTADGDPVRLNEADLIHIMGAASESGYDAQFNETSSPLLRLPAVAFGEGLGSR